MPFLLLSGKPRVGKTTLLKEIIKDLDCAGFYTEEIIQNKKRIGFKIKTLDGKETVLAKVGLQSKFRLGRYGVDIKGLEDIGLSAIREGLKQGKIIVIDEIGKMEFFSEEFRKEIISLLSLDITLIGVIHREFLSLIKDKSQIKLLEVTPLNHYQILNECKEWIRKNLQI